MTEWALQRPWMTFWLVLIAILVFGEAAGMAATNIRRRR